PQGRPFSPHTCGGSGGPVARTPATNTPRSQVWTGWPGDTRSPRPPPESGTEEGWLVSPRFHTDTAHAGQSSPRGPIPGCQSGGGTHGPRTRSPRVEYGP